MTTFTDIKKHSVTLGFSLLLLCLGQNNARALNLPDVPLSVFSTVEHNVLLTFDDSGSMAWGYMPDTISGNGGTRRACSSTFNGMAYNPAITYTPPPVRTSPGNSSAIPANLADSNFGNAWRNGFLVGPAVNLSLNYVPTWAMTINAGSTITAASCSVSTAGVPAFYFVYDATIGGCSPQTTATENNDACYRLVQHNNAAAGGAWTAAEQTNFANWYSYYRVRNLAAKSAAGRAFRGFDNNVRVAGQHLNNGTAGAGATIKFTAATSTNATNMLKRFCDDPTNSDSLCRDGTIARTEFFNRLYNSPASGGTPLRAAMQRAGNSFALGATNQYSPYREVPGDPINSANPELSCRKNFHIMMTDGYWNSDTATVANTDGSSRTLGDGTTTYSPIAPYSDAWSGTLADHAFDYWARDLRTDLSNNVSHSIDIGTGDPLDPWDTANLPWDHRNNPARWQHMQTFTIGMGIPGTRDPDNYFNLTLPASDGDWDELLSGALAWPQPCDGCATDINNIDDLWHAAVNGRGTYYSARDPDTLYNAFTEIIAKINAISGSAAGLGASGGSTSGGGTSVFQVAYDTGTWAGRLISHKVVVNGAIVGSNWEAGTNGLNTQNYAAGPGGRNIITYNPTKAFGSRGVPFQWTDLSAAQQTALNTTALGTDTNGSARLDYLRGASANEGAGLNFRVRTCYNPSTVVSSTLAGTIPPKIACPADVGKLGDIIDSSPVFVGKPDFAYPDTLESSPYSTFVTAQASRQKMVYVGANDGMLHGFQDSTSDGKELIAYVPNMVYTNIDQKNLSLLTSPFYTHRFYVNATPTVGDAFVSGAWRTMLVGGMRRGGKGYYALDITDPSSFSEANAAQIAKWEFTDPDLGFSYSQPAIVKIADSTGTGTPKSRWVAIFGNGYYDNNGASPGTGRAMIYIVDLATGSLIQKIDTQAGGGGGTPSNPSGMGTPAVVDLNDDFIADYIYAGDLLGNMWRIDVRSNTPADWGTAANVLKLFTATNGATPTPVAQPITTKPSVGFHPLGYGGLMVYFGTGKFLENFDNVATGTQVTQSFYGIYDRGATGRAAEPSRSEPTLIGRADLLQQDISPGPQVTNTITGEIFNTRNITDKPINWRLDRSTNGHLGWFVDFNLSPAGEKQVTDPLLREGRIIFTTLSPGTDACNPGGTGWLMELGSTNGGRIDETLDLNGDGNFDSLDGGGSNYGAAGAQPASGGSLSSPIVLTNPDGPPPPGGPRYSETKLVVTSTGKVISMKEAGTPNAPEAWRQLK